MATLAADTPRRIIPIGTDIEEHPVIAADIIYEGAAVGDNASGYARPLAAGDPFRGFAEQKCDNAAGSAGDKRVRVRWTGLIQLAISSLAITDVGKDVFASDDNTFTLTQGANTRVGRVQRWVETGVGIINFEATSGQQAEITDSTGGTANGTLEDGSTVVTGVDGTGSNAASKADTDARLVTINNNFADLAASVNAIIRRLGN